MTWAQRKVRTVHSPHRSVLQNHAAMPVVGVPGIQPSAPVCAALLLIDVNGDGIYNSLTNVYGGVNFDLNSDGVAERVAWTAAGSDDAFLVLDRNGNGKIDNGAELFGSATPQPPPRTDRPGRFLDRPNGFLALAQFDKPENGGDDNGLLNNRDAMFSSLRLWQDTNHNGISEPDELHTLASLGIISIEVAYEQWTGKDKRGNWYRYRALVVKEEGGERVERWAHDVHLVSSKWENNGGSSQR